MLLSTIIIIGIGNVILVFLALPLMGVMTAHIIAQRKRLGTNRHVNILAQVIGLKWQWQVAALKPQWQIVTQNGEPLQGQQIPGLGLKDAQKVYTIILLTGAAIIMVGHLILLQVAAPASLSGLDYFLSHVVFMVLAAMAQYGVRINGFRLKTTLEQKFAMILLGGQDYSTLIGQKIAALGQRPVDEISRLEVMTINLARERVNWRGNERAELEQLLFKGLMGREPNLDDKLNKYGQMINKIFNGILERIERKKNLSIEMVRLALVLEQYKEGQQAERFVEFLGSNTLVNLLETGQWPQLDQYLDGIEANAEEFAKLEQQAKAAAFDDDDPPGGGGPVDPPETKEDEYEAACDLLGIPYDVADKKTAGRIMRKTVKKKNEDGTLSEEVAKAINPAFELILEYRGWNTKQDFDPNWQKTGE